jgi:hypothetical protein
MHTDYTRPGESIVRSNLKELEELRNRIGLVSLFMISAAAYIMGVAISAIAPCLFETLYTLQYYQKIDFLLS